MPAQLAELAGPACLHLHRGRNAKELSVAVLEREQPPPVTRLEHANYLGEFSYRAGLLRRGWAAWQLGLHKQAGMWLAVCCWAPWQGCVLSTTMGWLEGARAAFNVMGGT